MASWLALTKYVSFWKKTMYKVVVNSLCVLCGGGSQLISKLSDPVAVRVTFWGDSGVINLGMRKRTNCLSL